jgi:hypothetical protein
MNGKNRIYYFIALVFCLASCTAQHRLSRILKNNPHLYEIFRNDSIYVRDVRVTDSVFFFQKESDTIRLEYATIFRNSDTIRIRQSCPSCTTYISQQVIQPTQRTIKERGQKRTLREKLEDALLPLICGFLIGFIINIKR